MRSQGIKEKIYTASIKPISGNVGNSVSICRIHASWFFHKNEGLATGFFIKIRNEENHNLYQHFLMTCEHVITKEKIEDGRQDIDIYYHLEKAHLSISLDKNERFIKEYITDYNVDITIVELKENEIPNQYFLEPDYNMIGNYKQYLKKQIIIHQYPKGREQCFSEGNIIYIDEKKRQLYYDVSTQDGSSGSPVVVKDSMLVIGVHMESNFEENSANFLDVVLTDNERKNYVHYIGSNNNPRRFVANYTSQRVLVERTRNERIYNKENYKIILKKNYNNDYDLTIININTHSEFNTQFNSEENIFDIFDLKIYNCIIVETEEELEFNINYAYRFYIPRKRTESLMTNSSNYSNRLSGQYNSNIKKESMYKPQKERMFNEFNNLSLNPYSYNNQIKNEENKKTFVSKTTSSETKTNTYKKNDDLCNIW